MKYLTKVGIYAVAFREWEYLDILNFEELANKNMSMQVKDKIKQVKNSLIVN